MFTINDPSSGPNRNIMENSNINSPIESSFSNEKKCEKRVKRPMNAFMVFSRIERQKIRNSIRGTDLIFNNMDVSVELGERWRRLSAEQKAPFIAESERLKRIHTAEHPNYKYHPRKRSSKTLKNDSPNSLSTADSTSPYNENYFYKGYSPISSNSNLSKKDVQLHELLAPSSSNQFSGTERKSLEHQKFCSTINPLNNVSAVTQLNMGYHQKWYSNTTRYVPAVTDSCAVIKRLLNPEPESISYNSCVYRGPSFCEQCAIYRGFHLRPVCYINSDQIEPKTITDLDEVQISLSDKSNSENKNKSTNCASSNIPHYIYYNDQYSNIISNVQMVTDIGRFA